MNPDAVRASRVPLTAEALASAMSERAALTALAVTQESASTNSDLLAALAAEPSAWPHLSALVADHQTAGRGRAGREWHTPPGAALTVSFVLRPRLPRERWGLIPLVVGLACVKTLREDGVDARLKWPNDVVVDGGDDLPGWGALRKIAGILCEVRGDAVVAGIGVNVSQTRDELPVPHAASLVTLGAAHLDRASLLEALAQQVALEIGNAERDADAMVAQIAAVTCTLGWRVVVERPGEGALTGEAVGLREDGALLVRTADGADVAVVAGDVRLRSVT